MLWSVRTCANPAKGWILDSNGNKITNLISSKTCCQIVIAHNREVEYYLNIAQKYENSLEYEMKKLRGDL